MHRRSPANMISHCGTAILHYIMFMVLTVDVALLITVELCTILTG